jgi:SAM-dependent methyltransferase
VTRYEEIQKAYRQLGKDASFYDGMITYSSLPGKAVCRLVWNLNKEKSAAFLERALAGVPADFSGRLLEVPVGTGVLTMPLYESLPHADVTCMDLSKSMMAAAQKRASRPIQFLEGDVACLPFEGSSFDIVLSLNGFHAFGNKEKAWKETFRVLKPGGTFCGCFYIQGQNARTDWLIRTIYVPKGYFTPPFETLESLRTRLEGMYDEVVLEAVEGIACFACKKAGVD